MEQVEQLNTYIQQVENRLKKSKNIKKRVVCTSTRKNGYQYYLMENGKRIYVKSKDIGLVRDILQKDYDERMYTVLTSIRYHIRRFLKIYDVTLIDKVYSTMADARKQLVQPLIPSDEKIVETWYQNHNGNQNPYPEQGTYQTARGEYVRSKSEKIIADLFEKYKIPYCYEPGLKLVDGRNVFPDFAVLNVRCRKTMYWEHFGLIDVGDYASKTLRKISAYEESGYVIGKNLIISMEAETMPLNMTQLENKIKKYLL